MGERHVDHDAPPRRRRMLLRRVTNLMLAWLAVILAVILVVAVYQVDVLVSGAVLFVFGTGLLMAFFGHDLTLAYQDAWDFDDEGVVATEFIEWSRIRWVGLGPSPWLRTFDSTFYAMVFGVDEPTRNLGYALGRYHPFTPPHDSPVWQYPKNVVLGLQRASAERIDLLANHVRMNVPTELVDPRVLALAKPRHEVPVRGCPAPNPGVNPTTPCEVSSSREPA